MRCRFGFGSIAASLFVGGLIALSVTGNAGCSVIYSDGADQCSTDGDCHARGLASSTCSPDRVCIAGCVNDDQCTQENGGRASLCGSDSKCVKLEIDGCTLPRDAQGALIAAYKDPNAIFIGELSARTSTQIPGSDAANQLVMADDEIRTTQPQGLPGGPGGGRRPLVRVTCETGDDPARMSAYAKHFVDVVNAPIIISAWNNHAIRVHTAVTASKKSVLEYCVACTADIRRFAAGGGDVSTIFSGTAAGVDIAPGIAAKASDVENVVRANPSFSGDTVRLALLVTTGLEGAPTEQTADEVLKTLRFNGKSAAENGSDYRLFQYSATSDRQALAKQVASFAPHILIPITLAEANQTLFPLIEGNWPAGAIRPEYVGSVGQQQASMIQLVQGNDDLRRRVVIVNLSPAPQSPQRLADWQTNYGQRFGPPGLAPLAYDAYYAIAYMIVAAGTPPTGKLTGTDVVRSLSKLKGAGSTFFVGPGDLVAGMSTVVTGPINLSGLVLPFNFNLDTGRMKVPQIPIICIGRPPTGPLTFAAAGQLFNVASQTLQGTYSCPGG